MPTIIIGFLPIAPDSKTPLPVGLTKNGAWVDTNNPGWPQECKLILLNEGDYMNCQLGGWQKTDVWTALLVQHLTTSSEEWESQKKWLENLSYKTQLVNRFHRIPNEYPFWKDLINLFDESKTHAAKAEILSSMEDRYKATAIIQQLDVYAAWNILYELTTKTEDKTQYSENCLKCERVLPVADRAILESIIDIDKFLVAADKIACQWIAS